MLLYSFDLLGTIVFALTGILMGFRKEMDLFGIFVLAFVTAVGGGTIRDIILGSNGVFWIVDQNYLFCIFASIPLGLILRKYLHQHEPSLLVFDAFGLAIFTVIGIQKTLAVAGTPMTAILMGVVTGAGGGVIRDILAGMTPLILKKNIYAAASIAGGLVYVIGHLFSVPENWLIISSCLLILTIRLLDIRFDLSLPRWSL